MSTYEQNGYTDYYYLGSQLVAKYADPRTQSDEPGYTGHVEDNDLQLTYMQQRYYDPVIGRFYSNDPVGFTASNPMMFNRYAYANNNPYKFVDPDGRSGVGFLIRITPPPVSSTNTAGENVTGLPEGITSSGGFLTPKEAFASAYPLTSMVIDIIQLASESGADSTTDTPGEASENSDSKSGHRNQDTPSTSEPNSTIVGEHRTREYGSNGKPVRDYDKPHQGHQKPHVHEWPNGVREHPGRDYTPLPEKRD